jgi:restriction endonuclease S subunit
MLESLKRGGRCAVIVSEGFLTWDQNSARALRRALLDECDLKAVISLPQGVFVSKGGQGPKTSILCFVKGGRTRNVWFYKVTNDGYTMGTNRKPSPGCQLVEALDLFHRYVREGKQPPETRHSFCIPADWIKVLDPRVKDKIRNETRAEMSARAAEDKIKLVEKLDAQVAAKKFTATERKDRLAQHDELWRSKTENAIAQKIDRAHLYSFNLPNYRSTLTPEQLAAWKDFAATYLREDDPSKTLEKQYRAIAAAAPDELDELISGLDPRHTLELDIARQFLTGISPKLFTKHPHLRTLQDVIASQQKLPRVPLNRLLRLNTDTVAPSDFPDTRFRVLGVNNETGVFLNETLPGSEINQRNYRVKPGEFCYNPYRINVGSIGLNEFDYDNQIISGAYVVFGTDERELHPKFLGALFKSPHFLAYVNEKASGGVRMNFKFEHLEDWEIPLPTIEEQNRIAEDLDRVGRMARSVEQVLESWQLVVPVTDAHPQIKLSEVITESMYGSSDKADYGDIGHPILRIGNIGFCAFDLSDIKRVELSAQEFRKYRLAKDDFLIVRSNGNPALVGKCAVWDGTDDLVFASYLIRFRFDRARVNPRYVMFYLMSPKGRALLSPQAGGGTYNISASVFQTVKIPLPSLDEQQIIVADLDAKMKLLAELRSLKEEAERSIQQTLNRVWEG